MNSTLNKFFDDFCDLVNDQEFGKNVTYISDVTLRKIPNYSTVYMWHCNHNCYSNEPRELQVMKLLQEHFKNKVFIIESNNGVLLLKCIKNRTQGFYKNLF